ncbi:hypothetical protein [Alishewanella tabrizica]|uniref:Transposase n=1 Tax=Alishewanella tabrizica TaxID=671278 RepID=A0ABQ2WF82_9ALTE|nr:hypothetical protein [Alishewanella tabrizica]GGW49418.1 hypothetical protein GCM10008111_01440 [Alishewanella tabrizica]
MDAGQELTRTYLQRLCVQYRLQAAWRFDLTYLLERLVYQVKKLSKGFAPILNPLLLKVTQV